MEKNEKEEINIRQAHEQDIPLIMDLIRSIADFEELGEQVLSTEKDLEKALFGNRIYAEVLIAEFNGKAAGFVMFFHNFSSFTGKPGLYIEDIFIHEAFRGLGIGRALMVHCGRIAKERNCCRMEWSVLDWNPARTFYEHFGGEYQKEWLTYRLDEKGINELTERK